MKTTQLQNLQRMTMTLLSTLDKPSDNTARSTLPAYTAQIKPSPLHTHDGLKQSEEGKVQKRVVRTEIHLQNHPNDLDYLVHDLDTDIMRDPYDEQNSSGRSHK